MTTSMPQDMTEKLRKLRLRFPELLRRGQVLEVASEFGLSIYQARQLIEGSTAPLKPHSYRAGARGWFTRESVLECLSAPYAQLQPT
jgi:hypothetical protein